MKNMIKVILSFFIFLFMQNILLLFLNIDSNTLREIDQLYMMYFADGFSLILIIYIFKEEIVSELSKLKDVKYKSVLKHFGTFICIKLFVAVISVLLSVVLNIEFITPDNQQTITALLKESKTLIFILTVVTAPVLEEIVFRLSFRKVTNNKYIFMLLSGLTFGLLHVFPADITGLTLIQSLLYVSLGIHLAYIYEKEENLAYPIIIHLLNNLLGFVMLF